MSIQKERKVNYEGKGSDDAFEGTSARTRPYSFEEVMFNRKNKKVAGDHGIEKGGTGDNVDMKLEVSLTGKDEKRSKRASHGVRDKIAGEIMDITLKRNERRTSIKLESVIVGKIGVSPVEPKVKSKIVDSTRDKETIGDKNAQSFLKIEKDEQPHNTVGDTDGYSNLKSSMSKRRSGDYCNEKSERDDKRKERNQSDQKSDAVYFKAEYKRKEEYSEHRDKMGRELEKAGRENDTVHRNDLSRKRSNKDTVKKHHVSKKDADLPNRREKRGSPPHIRDQPSKRRRRSSSREHKRDRDQKLSLHEGQKHMWDNHAVSSSHSSKDRSAKHVSELDNNSKFTNGSTGHKGSKEYTEKLGGYSPRKRRNEDSIQSPTKGVLGKKRLGWDTPHTESDIILSSASVQYKPSLMPQSSGVSAVSSSLPEPSLVNFNVQSAMHSLPFDSVQLTQSTQSMRRLIIENVPATVSEKDVMECLNKFLLHSSANFFQGTRPCINCVIHNEKRQALVEFLTPEYASAALFFKGFSLLGADFKIRRPKDFVPVENATHEKSVASVDAVSDTVEDSSHKIFIGGISRNISPKMLMEIASAFGPLRAYKFLVKNDNDERRAFMQYLDQCITAKACAGLNGMKLGGQTLTAIQATAANPLSDKKRSSTYDIPECANPLLAVPTEVLLIKNVFDPELFSSLSQPEIDEVLDDVRLESTRFGTVKSINVVLCNQCDVASSEMVECGAARSVPTESTDQGNYSGESGMKVGSAKQMAKEDRENNVKSDNHSVEDPPVIEVINGDNLYGEEKTLESDCMLSNEVLTQRSEAYDKPSSILDETGSSNQEAEGTVGRLELISPGDNKHSLSSSSEPGSNSGTMVEVAEEKEGPRQWEGLRSALLPGSICIEYKRSEATCIAAHCFNGRAFDNRVVSVEYLALDIYKRMFPK